MTRISLPVEKVKLIDDDIASHFLAIAHLRSQCNALLPIAHLPDETLSLILKWFVDITREDLRTRMISKRPYRWIIISHVCRHWREVALSTPGLWCHIQIGRMALDTLQAFITRSKQVPLQIEGTNIPASLYTTAYDVVSPHFARATTLEFRLSNVPEDAMGTQSPGILPLLRNLKLLRHSGSRRTPLPSFWLASEKPLLIDLSTSGFRIDWPNFTLPRTLQRLEITCAEEKAPVSEVVDVVKGLPSLVRLKLALVIAPISGPLSNVRVQETPMAFLKKLELRSSSLKSCIEFLRHFSRPPSVQIDLEFRGLVDLDDVPPLASVLQSSPDQCPADVVQLHGEGTFSITRRRPYPLNHVWAFTHDIHVSFDTKNGLAGTARTAVCTLCALFPLQDASRLHLSNVSYHSTTLDVWRGAFASVNHVQALHLSFYEDPLRRGALKFLHGWDLDGNAEGPLLPQITTLHLNEIRFRSCTRSSNVTSWTVEPDGTIVEESDFEFTEKLRRVLFARHDHTDDTQIGTDIELLVVDSCINVDKDDIKKLQMAVKVDWDEWIWDGYHGSSSECFDSGANDEDSDEENPTDEEDPTDEDGGD